MVDITGALCPTALAFPECPHATDAYFFLVFSIMHLFTFKRAFFPSARPFCAFWPKVYVGGGEERAADT